MIQRSKSPLHVVTKEDGTVRLVLDLRGLNKFIIRPKIQVEEVTIRVAIISLNWIYHGRITRYGYLTKASF